MGQNDIDAQYLAQRTTQRAQSNLDWLKTQATQDKPATQPQTPAQAVDALPSTAFGTIAPRGMPTVTKPSEMRLPFRSAEDPRGTIAGNTIGEGFLSGVEKEAT